MFHITQQSHGQGGSFVKLIQLEQDDWAVIVRSESGGRLYHRYIGPDFSKAQETFAQEAAKISSPEQAL
jgi:hypothetical protein